MHISSLRPGRRRGHLRQLRILASCIALAFVFALAPTTRAQPGDSLIVRGKHILREGIRLSDRDAMYAARATFERAMADTGLSAWAHYYIALTDYRIANMLLAEENQDRASQHLKEAVTHLETVIRIDPKAAEAHALLSSVYGRQISLNAIKGMFLGPKAGNALKKAVQLAPDNPRVVLSVAMSDFNTPEMWGGSKERALAGFQRAAELFSREKPTDPILPTWGHSETYAWLGLAYLERDDRDSARAAIKKALEIDPHNDWVKYVLMPKLAQE